MKEKHFNWKVVALCEMEQNKRYREFINTVAKEMHFEGDSKLDTQNKLIRIILNARDILEESE